MTKKWRHLDFFQYRCELEARVPRVDCPEHGVRLINVAWGRAGSGFTPLFEALMMMVCREMPIASFAKELERHNTCAQQIELLSMDMKPAFIAAAATYFPQAEVVFDHFHIIQMAGKAHDEVRKELLRDGGRSEGFPLVDPGQ